ncbi:MAG: class I SAM-dependent methyltransferase [Myxococcota bacterium]
MTIREDYDRVAEAYSAALRDELEGKPLDRWLLERVAIETKGAVLEIGCGPGQVAGFLATRGATVHGLDLSAAMIAEAQHHYPKVSFQTGDFHRLPFADASLGAVVAMYALVHLEVSELAPVLAEVARVLRPGGLFLAATHAGEERLQPGALFGVPVELTWIFHPPAAFFDAVQAAGLMPLERIVREPYLGAEHGSRRAYVLAKKPG